MRIGIFGGAFDPPHKGHLRIAETVINELSLDEIRFVPTKVPAHKQPSCASGESRVQMISRMIESNSKFVVDEVELSREGTSFTIDTIEFYKRKEPENKFYLIIGGDQIQYLPNWSRIDDLVAQVTLVGVARPAYHVETKYPVTMVEINKIAISSSEIREKIAKGISVADEVPGIVLQYIEENKLYEG